jgi:hypothetical protein
VCLQCSTQACDIFWRSTQRHPKTTPPPFAQQPCTVCVYKYTLAKCTRLCKEPPLGIGITSARLACRYFGLKPCKFCASNRPMRNARGRGHRAACRTESDAICPRERAGWWGRFLAPRRGARIEIRRVIAFSPTECLLRISVIFYRRPPQETAIFDPRRVVKCCGKLTFCAARS